MPTSSLIIIIGSWLVLAGLSIVAYRFNRERSDD
jgi:hypothetical protein